jgi:hypothetical protein
MLFQSPLDSLVPVELDRSQHAADLVGVDLFGGLGAFTGGPQPEAAEIIQSHDIALCQLGRDNSEETFDGWAIVTMFSFYL